MRVCMKAALALLVAAAAGMIVAGQPSVEPKLLGQLKRLFPSATSFSPKEGNPPHFSAYVNEPPSGAPQVAGFAFWTTDLEPLERGYEGPLKILLGLNTTGILSGIIGVDHHEPYGSCPIHPPDYPPPLN